MELEHNFTVPAPVSAVWEALLDLERVVACMPGATLSSHQEDEFAGTVKVRLGPISLQYKGSGRFTEKDEGRRRVVIEASGRDARGNGTAAATVTAQLAGNGPGTAVTVVTDLSVTGRPAQFGRGMISEVGGKIVGQFADCLAGELGTGQPAPAPEPQQPTVPADGQAGALAPRAATPSPAAPVPATPSPAAPSPAVPAPVAEEINLLGSASTPVLKRVAPVAAGLLVLLLVVRTLTRRRRG